MSAAFLIADMIRDDIAVKGIGRKAPSTPLDILALCKSGALTSRACDGSSFNHGRVKLHIEPPTYPPVWRQL